MNLHEEINRMKSIMGVIVEDGETTKKTPTPTPPPASKVEYPIFTTASDATQTVRYNPDLKKTVQSNPVKPSDYGLKKFDKPIITPNLFTELLKNGNDAMKKIINTFNDFFGRQPTRIRLIFPKEGWETAAVKWLKSHGVVTGVFTSISSAIQTVKELRKNKVKADELVVGSHGDGYKLLMSQEGDEHFSEDLLKEIKTIINPNTTVFFTACKGADYLSNLVDAANKIGIGVYGASGLYNYVVNSAEKGYYYCKPMGNLPIDKLEPKETFSGYTFIEHSGYISFEKFYTKTGKTKIKLIFEPESIDILKLNTNTTKPLPKNSPIEVDLADYECYTNYVYDLVTKTGDNFFTNEFIVDSRSLFYDIFKEYNNMPKGYETNFSKRFKSAFDAGFIKIMVNGQDIKQCPPIKGYKFTEDYYLTNSELLKNNICKKVPSSPISWWKL
jgi:hypothetical protein